MNAKNERKFKLDSDAENNKGNATKIAYLFHLMVGGGDPEAKKM